MSTTLRSRSSAGLERQWLVATTVSAFMYEGPYRWLAELQLALFARYYVMLTFAFALFVCMGGVVFGMGVFARRLGCCARRPRQR